MRLPILLSILLIVAACQPATTAEPAMLTATPQLTGEVRILSPVEGTTVYSEVVRFAGTASDLTDEIFDLVLTGPDETIIAQHTVRPDDQTGAWQVELPHTYNDAPIEVTVMAAPPDTGIPYEIITIVLAGLDHRPAGVFGSITFPAAESSVGGDRMQVKGTVSGARDNTFMLNLVNNNGVAIESVPVSIEHPNVLDEIQWSTEIDTEGYVGEASLQISTSDENVIHSIDITIDIAAG